VAFEALGDAPAVVVLVAAGWAMKTQMELSWVLVIVYVLLLAPGLLGLLLFFTKKYAPEAAKEEGLGPGIAVSLLASVTTQFVLRFFAGFSWTGSILIGLGVLLVPAVLFALARVVKKRVLDAGPAWAFGNLPSLDLGDESDPARSALEVTRFYRQASLRDPSRSLAVQVNDVEFYPGEPLMAEKLEVARFERAGTMAQVQARAQGGQKVFVTKRCKARSFGGEFIAGTLMKEDTPPPVISDLTTYLFFGDGGLERITLVLAGGRSSIDGRARSLSRLASEMWGQPDSGSRGQDTWRSGPFSLVSEVESWKVLRRGTFTWTLETLESGRT
jgi:hypothetical protein